MPISSKQMKLGRAADAKHRSVSTALSRVTNQSMVTQRSIEQRQTEIDKIIAEVRAIGQDPAKKAILQPLISRFDALQRIQKRDETTLKMLSKIISALTTLEATVVQAMQNGDFKLVVRGVSDRKLAKGLVVTDEREYRKLLAMIEKFITRVDAGIQEFTYEADELERSIDQSTDQTSESVGMSTMSDATLMARVARISADTAPAVTAIPTVVSADAKAGATTATSATKKA